MNSVLIVACALVLAGCSRSKEAPPQVASSQPEYFRVDPATAATLRGEVRFEGEKPPAKLISMDAEEACQKLHAKPVYTASVVTGKQSGLASVLVYVKSGLGGKTFEPPGEAVILDQRGCQFIPRVIALRTGQTLTVKNSDPVSHNIHPTPRNSYEWNQQQSPGAADLRRRFAHPEVMIPVKCNVHAWMRSYIGVMDHPYFAVTSEAGHFEWKLMPPGEYTVSAWHETLGELTETIKIGERSNETLTFTFSQPAPIGTSQ